jgi:hypothetical protein
MEDKGVGGFEMTLVITRYPPEQFTRATVHYPGMGRGLVRSLFTLVRGASHYIRVCRTPESGLSQEYGQ